MANYDIFREQLGIRFPASGHALWDPSPSNPDRPVEVGDVGFIRRGRFHRLFNALLPADDESQDFGVPEYYEQLVPSIKNHISKGSLSRNRYCSAGVRVEAESEYHRPAPDDFQRVSFTYSERRGGAVLSVPVKARSADTIARSDFSKWIVKHIDRCFAFVRRLGLGIEHMEDIILVTGCDRAKSWTNVAFLGGQVSRVSFEEKVVEALDSSILVQFSPGHIEGALLNQGPEGKNLPEDQCIFLRGFRVTRAFKLFPKRLKAAAGPSSEPEGYDCEPDMEVIPIPGTSRYQDPLHVLLDYVAEQAPDCDMALIHDDDLERVEGIGEGTSLESLQPDVLMDLLRGSNIEIHKVCCNLSPADSYPSTDTGVVWVAMFSMVSKTWNSVLESQLLPYTAHYSDPDHRRAGEPPLPSSPAIPDGSPSPSLPGDINKCKGFPVQTRPNDPPSVLRDKFDCGSLSRFGSGTATLFAIPIEILERIALELALSCPLGPPADLIALLCTCKYVHDTLSFHSSPHLYAKIFRGMFDIDAPRRRLGGRSLRPHILALQLKTYCTALRRIRRQDVFAPDIEDLLRTAFILLTENDGKNIAQLEWANTYALVNDFIRYRLWQDTVNGWPRDTPLHALALWVMWCMTDRDVLASESPDERKDLVTCIVPYVVVAFKYLSYFAPDHHLFLPLLEDRERNDLVSLQSVHGEYPVLPPRGDTIAEVFHFGRPIRFRTPPITIAAKLLYFSRIIPPSVLSDLPVDRPTALKQDISWGHTQADIMEVNSQASAQFVDALEWDWKSIRSPEQAQGEEHDIWRHDLHAPSAAWDSDWERFTTCWDPWAKVELKGTVYTFGSLDGLWQGRLLIPESSEDLALMTNPNYPENLSEGVPFMTTWPMFMRLKEHHCISPQVPVPPGGLEDDPFDDGIRNAWLPSVELVKHRDRAIFTYHHMGEIHRTEYETFQEGRPNSHEKSTCLTCRASADLEETMRGVEDGPLPRHSDYEDVFAEAGLPQPSYDNDNDEDALETTCVGIRDIIITGETDSRHGMAWGRFTFLGRVRPWDGLIALVRLPVDPNPRERSRWVFRGYLHYGKVLVGSWRGMTMDVESIPWEGPFVASKRD